MENKKLKVLHIDIEKGWRGGQQQSFYLHSKLINQKIDSLMLCRKSSAFETHCKNNNVRVLSINFHGEYDFISGLFLAWYCYKNKINIIVSHSSHSLSLGLFAKLFYRKMKLIAVRRVDFQIRNNLLSKWKYQTMLLNKIVCVSDYVKKIISINDKISNKVITITDGIDTQRYKTEFDKRELRKKYDINSDSLIVGTIASFVGHKDYETLIRAIPFVLEKIQNIFFIFVGDGYLMNPMKMLASELNVDSKIRFEGFQTRIVEYLNLFDIFVLSSKMEGLGTSILDAQSAGIPVVATAAGGIPEIIINGYNGELVPPQNPKLLADAIVKFCENENYRKKISANSLITVKEYDIQITYQKYLKLFNELLND